MARTPSESNSAVTGCTSYAERWVNLFFTNEEVCCKYCQLLETYSRPQCRRTGEMIVNTNAVGYWCPLLTADSNGRIVKKETGEVMQT